MKQRIQGSAAAATQVVFVCGSNMGYQKDNKSFMSNTWKLHWSFNHNSKHWKKKILIKLKFSTKVWGKLKCLCKNRLSPTVITFSTRYMTLPAHNIVHNFQFHQEYSLHTFLRWPLKTKVCITFFSNFQCLIKCNILKLPIKGMGCHAHEREMILSRLPHNCLHVNFQTIFKQYFW